MPSAYSTRNLTVDEVFVEFLNCCEAQSLVHRKHLRKIRMDMTLKDFVRYTDGEAEWSDFPAHFGIQLTMEWWKSWESPGTEATLRNLCADLASRIEVPVSEPVTVLGKSCDTAGMFLMMKQLLVEQGADAETIAPSTPIKAFANKYPRFFCKVRLAKVGRLPAPDFNGSGLIASLGLAFSIATGVAANYYASVPVWGCMLIAFIAFCGSSLVMGRIVDDGNTDPVRFPGIVTFRDFIDAAFDKPIRRKA